MKNVALIFLSTIGVVTQLVGAGKPEYIFSREGGYAKVAAPVPWAKQMYQGFGMKMLMNNEMILGNQATSNVSAIGLDYPAGSNTEHLFGGGPIIGGIWNGLQRRVSAGYWEQTKEFEPELRDSGRDRLWETSAYDTLYNPNRPGYYKYAMSQRGVDDDHDGKIDEDELDGLDNDGDWNPLTDDIGADGVPDSLEVGCRGSYDPLTNADPAFDNYNPSRTDPCHPNPDGSSPRMSDKNKYTEKNGIPDHGEPHVDEDYAAVSDHDVYCSATDTFKVPSVGTLFPLGVKLWMKSYAWQAPQYSAILPIDYIFVNVGKVPIKDVYVGWNADMDVGPIANGSYATDDYSGYIPETHTAYISNAIDRGSTPLGITILGTPRPLDSLRFVYQWYLGNPTANDSIQYEWLSCAAFGGNCILPDQSPSTPNDIRVMIGCGPLGDMNPGDTIKLSVALVSGNGITAGENPMLENARTAIKFFRDGYRQPTQPISPCIEITPGFKRVTVKWGRLVACPNGQPGADPREVWDDSNKVAGSFPPDHWRRANPPLGHSRGGRIFEGYRLYRSEDPDGSTTSFTLLKQYDINDEFSYNSGLDSVFVDSNLVRGKRYWYSVTAFGIRDRTILITSPAPGEFVYDTLYTPEPESPKDANKQSIDLPFSVSDRLGDVLVVPNPYRTDADYTAESGGWEGPGGKWIESNRKVKFIHLPKKCTVRVFSLGGDLVATIEHDDPVRGELEWNLVSDSNRALASGLYVFSVESEFGRQVGKFVIIR